MPKWLRKLNPKFLFFRLQDYLLQIEIKDAQRSGNWARLLDLRMEEIKLARKFLGL